MTNVPSPFVYWAQKESTVSLSVDLKDAQNIELDVDEGSLTFFAVGKGASGSARYGLRLQFYGKLDPDHKDTKHTVLDSKIEISLRKAANESWWPRLTSAPVKPPWLKIDFNRWESPQDNLPDEEEVGDVRMDYPNLYDTLEKEERGYRTEEYKKVYLVLYNIFQFVGFLYIMIVMCLRYASDGPDSMAATYENVGPVMKFCTMFQLLEVMHPLFGYTRNSVTAPLLQVFGRSIVLFAMIEAESRMQTKPVVFYLFIMWTAIELVRYPFYITQLNNFEIGWLTWLRYTLWIPLYPLGILCEGIIILRNIPYFEETKRFTVSLPNTWNFTFDTPTAMRLHLLVLFFPGAYFMMTHMYRDRLRKLAPKIWKQKKKMR